MTRLTLFCTWILAAGCLFGAAGDQITLKNGDRYSGTIVKSDDKQLVLKTEFAGTVTIQWDAVTAVNAAQPLTVVLKDGQNLVGPVTTAGEELSVAHPDHRHREKPPRLLLPRCGAPTSRRPMKPRSNAIRIPASSTFGPASSTPAGPSPAETPAPRPSIWA